MELEHHPQPDAGFFFPEVIGFAVGVVLSPVWAARLIHQGYYARALVMATTGLPFGIVFVWFLRTGRRWAAWFSIVAFFLILLLIGRSVPESIFNL